MSEAQVFKERSSERSGDEEHRKKLLRVIGNCDIQVDARRASQFYDWHSARHRAAQVKEYTLRHLPELLREFEEKISARGARVLWARDVPEAQLLFLDIVRRHDVHLVVKSKSMVTEEVHLNSVLREEGIEVVESDLGEFIQQLAGEPPYHIVTPAMHQSRQRVSQLFHEHLGSPVNDDPQALTMVAREALRSVYLRADLGVTGANFLIADQGAISISENEGNARLTTACPDVHVVFAGIEKVLPRLCDLELFLPLLGTSGTGQQVTTYSTVIRGPHQPGESDGPKAMYVILLDNGRSLLYGEPTAHESLRCIRCGACLNACPVYRTIGGHSYHTTYQGPIGEVITPHLKGFKDWGHLPFASSLCGACTDVCPVEIPLAHLIQQNRVRAVKERVVSPFWQDVISVWAWVITRPKLIRLLRPLGVFAQKLAPEALLRKLKAPRLAAKSFRDQYQDRQQVKKG